MGQLLCASERRARRTARRASTGTHERRAPTARTGCRLSMQNGRVPSRWWTSSSPLCAAPIARRLARLLARRHASPLRAIPRVLACVHPLMLALERLRPHAARLLPPRALSHALPRLLQQLQVRAFPRRALRHPRAEGTCHTLPRCLRHPWRGRDDGQARPARRLPPLHAPQRRRQYLARARRRPRAN